MNQINPHKYAAIIKAWADGGEVEYRGGFDDEYRPLMFPNFTGPGDYRIKPAVDKWADLKAAHNAGSVIQCRGLSSYGVWEEWEDANFPLWLDMGDNEYRIKPPTFSYRVAMFETSDGKCIFPMVAGEKNSEELYETLSTFKRWADERQTVEV